MKYIALLTLISCATQSSSLQQREISSSREWENYFKDITLSSGVDESHSGTIVMGDYNKDGKIDFMARIRLYENTSRPGDISFRDVTDKMGLSLSGQPIFMDINNDFLPDIITTKGQIFLRDKGVFSELSKKFGVVFPTDVHTMALEK